MVSMNFYSANCEQKSFVGQSSPCSVIAPECMSPNPHPDWSTKPSQFCQPRSALARHLFEPSQSISRISLTSSQSIQSIFPVATWTASHWSELLVLDRQFLSLMWTYIRLEIMKLNNHEKLQKKKAWFLPENVSIQPKLLADVIQFQQWNAIVTHHKYTVQ